MEHPPDIPRKDSISTEKAAGLGVWFVLRVCSHSNVLGTFLRVIFLISTFTSFLSKLKTVPNHLILKTSQNWVENLPLFPFRGIPPPLWVDPSSFYKWNIWILFFFTKQCRCWGWSHPAPLIPSWKILPSFLWLGWGDQMSSMTDVAGN